jgi:galactokinase
MNVEQLFEQHFGKKPEIVTRAPGRVNLIGEHTDYNEGFVLPVAIDKEIRLAAATNKSDSCRIYSESLEQEASFKFGEDAQKVEAWLRPIAGIAWAISEHTGHNLPGVDIVITSNLPIGAGLSSSAAIEMAPGVMWNTLGGLEIPPTQLALLGQKCENEFMGLRSGIMDQMTSMLGQEDAALFIDTRDLSTQIIPIPPDLTILVLDTGKSRKLASSKYNERRSECEQAIKEIQQLFPNITSLRDVTSEMLDQVYGIMTDISKRRARHVVHENERVKRMLTSLCIDNRQAVHALMAASHESLRFDYEVSSDELDLMVDSADFTPGCVGVRMTGAGFGGACVALVETARVNDFAQICERTYSQRTDYSPKITVCKAVKGASVVNY